MTVATSSRLVTVFGGSGFVGRHVVRALAQRGWRIRVAVRRPDLAGHLQPLGGVGQIVPVQANLRDRASIARALTGTTAVVNLVGILKESGRQTFDALQASGAGAVAQAAAEAGIGHMVQMSALGADAESASAYARSKAAGEAAVLAAQPDAVILRPSVVFGPEDEFFNRFAALARLLPVMPLVGAETRFQPVYAGDVGEAVALALAGEVRGGRVYELGGPDTPTLREIVAYVMEITGRKRPIVPLHFAAGRLQATVLELADKLTLGLMPDDLVITRDQVSLLEHDNVVSAAATAEGRTLEGIGLKATGYEAIVPAYLWRFRRTGQYGRPEAA